MAHPNLFIGVYPAGIVYADKSREKDGDYLRLAFLPYRTLVLEFTNWPKERAMLDAITASAVDMRKRRGEQFAISSCNQTVKLGG